jgi:hypothetical protein
VFSETFLSNSNAMVSSEGVQWVGGPTVFIFITTLYRPDTFNGLPRQPLL